MSYATFGRSYDPRPSFRHRLKRVALASSCLSPSRRLRREWELVVFSVEPEANPDQDVRSAA
jgi:hypothetical protein